VVVVDEWIAEGVEIHDAAKQRRNQARHERATSYVRTSYVVSGFSTAEASAKAVSRTVVC
jgi:hypothetical protein